MRRLLEIALLLPLATGALQGQTPIPVGGEFQVNSYTTGRQSGPAVAVDREGDFVVVWRSAIPNGTASSDFSIRGQRFSSDGAALGGELRINSYTTGSRSSPAVATDTAGNFIVVWSGTGDGSGSGVFGQRFASDGTAQARELQVNSYTTGPQFRPDVAVVGGGDFVVVWTRSDPDGDTAEVFGQRFAADGSRRGGEFQVSPMNRRDQDASVGVDAAGNFVVVWASYDEEANFYGIYPSDIHGRRFAADGRPLGPDFQVNSSAYAYEYHGAHVAVSGDGEYIVAWYSWRGEGSFYDVQGRLYSADGRPRGGEFRVNSERWSPINQRDADVAMASGGEFVVVWNGEYQDGGDYYFSHGGIVGRRYRSDGTPMEDEHLVNSYNIKAQLAPAVAIDSDGDFVVVWMSYGSNGSDTDSYSIQGQRYTVSVAAAFTWDPAIPRRDEPIRFSDTSTGREPRTWIWSFGDGSTSTQRNPTHTYIEPGSYTVSLTVSDGFGRATKSQVIVIPGPCVPGPTTLCFGDRFQVELGWRDFGGNTGSGQVVPFQADDSGLLWFFSPDNWEMLVKVLDGCGINDRFWVFAAATTNVEYTLRVTDTETGFLKEYFNPLGTAAHAITDTAAFAACP